jgi:aminoglycoside phosphotransferase (APT) family kinase protein
MQGRGQALATAREAEVNEPGKIEGIDIERVSAWMAARTPLSLPLAFKLIAGGRSNMTFTVTDAAGRRFVLRRPPLGKLLPSAHDMAREHRLMSALADTEVPVPRMVGLCQDPAVNERDFYVMHFLDGVVVRDIEVGRTLTPQARTLMCHSLIETLCKLHRVDVDAIGLGNLAKREGYVERQLKRWSGQWEQSRTRDLPLFDTVRDALAARMPAQSPATIAHGDYRLSNCMMDPSGPVVGVLDWELCTLGEPMADLGGLLGYWHDPSDPGQGGDPATTGLQGFLTQDEMAGLYADSMGVSLASVDYYRAFAQWRLASIGEGVYARYLGGQQGSQDEPIDLEAYKASIPRRVERAARLLGLKTSA